jgi:hypothetical protein
VTAVPLTANAATPGHPPPQAIRHALHQPLIQTSIRRPQKTKDLPFLKIAAMVMEIPI